MRNLWTYGCSHTAGWYDFNGKLQSNGTYREYYEYRNNNLPKIYTEIVSEELGLNLINLAEGGTSVTFMLWRMTETFQDWLPGDIILYQTTYQERYQMLNPHDKAFIPYSYIEEPTNSWIPPISWKAQTEFLANRTDERAWQRETMACIRSAKALADTKGCHFLVAPYDQYTIEELFEFPEQYEDIREYLVYQTPESLDLKWTFHTPYWTFGDFDESINSKVFQETNGEILDNHMGEIGHELQAKIISPYLRKFL